ncbi:hypothetical protein N182_34025 [Sinorhizobium sp. GL2]|nr:hypothetical protein N182_34025 [Sinorhizobium sp. GL2]
MQVTASGLDMELVKAEQNDLAFIASWLKAEEETYYAPDREDGGDIAKGFWCNWNLIEEAFTEGELEVVRVDGAAVAFHFGQFHTPGITEVHPQFRGKGIGTAIVEQLLTRAVANEVRILHVKCISDQSERHWSKFGFVPETEYSEDYYKVLRHPLPLPRAPDHLIIVNFYAEYDDKPYKTVEIPCLVENDQILLSELCHDAVIGSKAWGDRRVQIALDGKVIFQDWLTSREAESFGFYEGRGISRVAKQFNLPGSD